jgi:hypothetical protein
MTSTCCLGCQRNRPGGHARATGNLAVRTVALGHVGMAKDLVSGT